MMRGPGSFQGGQPKIPALRFASAGMTSSLPSSQGLTLGSFAHGAEVLGSEPENDAFTVCEFNRQHGTGGIVLSVPTQTLGALKS